MDRPLSDLITEKSNGRKQRPGRKFGGNKVEASARPRKLQNDFPPAFRNRSVRFYSFLPVNAIFMLGNVVLRLN